MTLSLSHTHISKGPKYLLLALIFLHMLAEGTMTVFHIRELILVLNKEATAVFAHVNCHIGHHILEVTFWVRRTEVAHILHEHLLIPHRTHHLFIHHYRPIILWIHVITSRFQDTLSEEVIF